MSVTPDEPLPSTERPPNDVPFNPQSLCNTRTRVDGPIVITSARELEQLRGCTDIRGDLTLGEFSATSLSPLSSLQTVAGKLSIGVRSLLDGLESLQEVGSLTLDGLQTASLQPLRNLWLIGLDTDDEGASLEIRDTFGFSGLTGLSGLRVVGRVEIDDNPSLTTLQGLTLPEELVDLVVRNNASLLDLGASLGLVTADRVLLDDNPLLSDLGGLGTLRKAEILSLEGLGVQTLNGLTSLDEASDLSVSDNANLVQADLLGRLRLVSLSVRRNPRLTSLPSFAFPDVLHQIQIRDNTVLGAGPSFPNATSASRLLISGNPLLARIDGFPRLGEVGTLEVRSNASLTALDLPVLFQYETARIVCNLALSEATVAPQLASAGGQLELRGNLDSVEPCN